MEVARRTYSCDRCLKKKSCAIYTQRALPYCSDYEDDSENEYER